jgi:hypothetical protein
MMPPQERILIGSEATVRLLLNRDTNVPPGLAGPLSSKVPVTLPPPTTLDGLRLKLVTIRGLIGKLVAADGPSAVVLITVMLAVPTPATSAAVTLASNCLAFTKMVVRSEPFQRTLEVFRK